MITKKSHPNWQMLRSSQFFGFFIFTTFTWLFGASPAYAQNNSQNRNQSNELSSGELESKPSKAPRGKSEASAPEAEAPQTKVAGPNGVRRFHEVLDELLAEFGYDVRMGQLNGLKNLSVRRVDVSEALPKSYEGYVELLIDERIRENSQVRLINCLQCRARTSSLVDGKLKITSPSSNITQLNAAAEQLGVENFMDVVLVYHTTHMVLAFQIFNTGTKELVWARAYNSETVRSRFQKLAIDYAQVAKARTSEEYVPDYKVLLGFGAAVIPNAGGTANDRTFLSTQFRGVERFNNRKDEFGLLLNILIATSTVVGDYPTTGTSSEEPATAEEETPLEPAAFTFATGFYGLYSHNFLGKYENYATIRNGVHFGLGGVFTSGYLTGSVHTGWDIYFGKRFATNIGIIYMAPSDITIGATTVKAEGGTGGDLGMSVIF